MRVAATFFVILIFVTGTALAGPNARVVLSVQGNALGVETEGDVCGAIGLPATCEELVTGATPDAGGISWYLAVVVSPPDNTPNFHTVVFGLGAYEPYGDGYISFYGPCVTGALEVSTGAWPGPGEGTAVSWAPDCLYGYMEPVYYFGTYNYGGVIPLGAHPVQGGVVVDCSADPAADHFVGFGAIEGINPDCPGEEPPPEPAACCIGEICVMLLETECADQGDWYGPEVCGAYNYPCPQWNPTQEATWGSIKSIYR